MAPSQDVALTGKEKKKKKSEQELNSQQAEENKR
jgi:hypothetical protein